MPGTLLWPPARETGRAVAIQAPSHAHAGPRHFFPLLYTTLDKIRSANVNGVAIAKCRECFNRLWTLFDCSWNSVGGTRSRLKAGGLFGERASLPASRGPHAAGRISPCAPRAQFGVYSTFGTQHR